MDQIAIGKFIAQCRKEQGLTQEQLSEKLGVSSKSVSRWENGNTMPDLSMFQTLCSIFNVELAELLSGKRLTAEERLKKSEENVLLLVATKSKLQSLQILTEILIFAGIIVAITLTSILAVTTVEKLITVSVGCFIWGFGMVLRVKLRKALDILTQNEKGS